MEDVDADEVRLTMPATPELLRVARLAAAGMAGQMGFDIDEIDDVKIAVDELCFLLVAAGGDGPLTLRYRMGDRSLTIEGERETDGTMPEPSELSAMILDAVVDEHEFGERDGAIRFRLVKRGGQH